MTKSDIAYTMTILLSLDRSMAKDLMKMQESTLNKMYSGYLQNAKNVNHVEDTVREQERTIREQQKIIRELKDELKSN